MKDQLTKLSLHIKHPEIDLAEVCRRLELTPSVIWRAGDERRTPKGRRLDGVRSDSYCSIELGPSTRSPPAKRIESALALLRPHRRILRKLVSTGGRISLFLGWFCDKHTGDALEHHVLGQAADLRIAIDFNVYVPDGSDKSG
ncbi:DUF4279 domain-containing protein [uncultured Bradyrhizobium sp.]|uniref:DUF4279 domain-containing protein n=1 Tax=uncultured Bradyrhizobium sp. TaxID=199684 RepID=UPI002602041A|nr:DUF4279 domain-containing protein [uncultured Bradyrhizobium sp.]